VERPPGYDDTSIGTTWSIGQSSMHLLSKICFCWEIIVKRTWLISVHFILQPLAELRAGPDFFSKNSPELGSNSNSPIAHIVLHILLHGICIPRPLDMFYKLV
jgi:hypothetical protein